MQASGQHLKQIALAMHNYHDGHTMFPGAYSKDENGKSLLSWRVQLLPYLEEEEGELFKEFHHDEPWDSPHNKTLIARMPEVYKSPGVKVSKPGMTTYQTVAGDNTIFPWDGHSNSIQDVLDGTSNTALLLDASPEFETIWTKPGDLKADPAIIRKALTDRFGNGGLLAFADGSVRELKKDLDDATISNLFERNDGQVIPDVFEESFAAIEGDRDRDPFGLNSVMGGRIAERDFYELLAKGLGNQVGLHVCDSDPAFDVQLTSILPQMFSGPQGMEDMIGGSLWIGMAVASLTSPVYIDVAVDDTAVVDAFLEKLDEGAAIEVRTHSDMGWFAFKKDFYTVQIGDTKARSFVLSLGPLKWRFFFSRIGSNICIASKLSTLEQLISASVAGPVPGPEPSPSRQATDGEQPKDSDLRKARKQAVSPAHAQLTVHRGQWNRIMPSVRLSWDEAARQACLDNIGPLTSAARVAAASGGDASAVTPEELTATASSIYGGVHRCPCGGQYVRTADGRMVCDVHGDADHPQQPAPNAPNGGSLEMLNSFSEIRVALTFLEDGLHAVLEIDRR